MNKLFHYRALRPLLGCFALATLALNPLPATAQNGAATSGESSGKSSITLTPLIIQKGEHLVANKIIVAGVPTAERLQNLVKQGIPIIDMLPADEAKKAGIDGAAVVKEAGGTYTHIAVTEKLLGDEDVQAKIFDALDAAYERKGSTFVYCRTGDRVGAALALHAAKRQGKTVEQALELGREGGLAKTEARVKELLGAK